MKTSPHWYDVIARWARCGKDIESLVKGKWTLLCLSWFLSSKSEGYLHGDLIWIKVESNEWYYAKKTNESRMSCLPLAHPPSSPPLPSLMESTQKFKMTFLLLLPLRPVLVFLILLLVFGGVRVPGEPFFIERDDHLRTLDVGLFRRHKVRFIWIFPLKRAKEKVI